jgi:hypothetical protein
MNLLQEELLDEQLVAVHQPIAMLLYVIVLTQLLLLLLPAS